MRSTDGELVRRTLEGDRSAFDELVDRYRHMAYGLAYHLTGEFESARDLAQEAFIQAYLKLTQLRDPGRFAGWLRRIVVNAHRSHARRPRVPTMALVEEGQPQTAAPQPSETAAAMHEALASLREPDRLALTLHYIDGYSHAEIAGFLGVGPEAVKTRLARARQRLKKEMAAMVEETFERERLPQEFTAETMAEAERRYLSAWAAGQSAEPEEAARLLAALLDEDLPAGVRARVHNNLGCLYHDKLGDPARGREHLRLAAEVQPEAFIHGRIYARVALGDHHWEEAQAAASRILAAAPTDFERRNLHVLLAAAEANLQRPAEALAHLAAAAAPGPEPPGADQWPFRVPAGTDPLNWVRANQTECFPSLMADPRFRELVGDER